MAEDLEASDHKIRHMVQSYPQKKRYILAMMQDIQKEFNYLSKEALLAIAEHVGTPFSRVYSMATFYKAFSLVPKGRFNIRVCDGTACHLKSSSVLIDQIYKDLKIKPGETTEDGMFSLETVNCLGACAISPVIMVNETVHPKVSSSGILEIIQNYRRAADDEC